MSLAYSRVWPLLLAALLCGRTPAQDLGLFDGDDEVDDLELEAEPQGPTDLEKLVHSHYAELWEWAGVRPESKREIEPDEVYHWEQTVVDGQLQTRSFVKPLDQEPITHRFTVPEAGRYRVWLGYLAETGKAHPVTLTLSGANVATHVYSAKPLPRVSPRELRRKHPIRIDSKVAADAMQFQPVVVWEYVDLDLKPGETGAAIATADLAVRLDALFISQCLTLDPSKSAAGAEGNLQHTWFRYRVSAVPAGVQTVNMGSFVHFIWPHYIPPSTNRIWYGEMGTITAATGGLDIPAGEWSGWLMADATVTNGGDYISDTITVTNAETDEEVAGGALQIQLAWYPHEAAVLRELSTGLFAGRARWLVPVSLHNGYRSAHVTEANPAPWGTRDAAYVASMRTERQFLEQLLQQVNQDELLPGVMPKRIRIFTTVRCAPDTWDVVYDLLTRTGINHFPDWPYATKKKFGLPLEDEIYQQAGTIAMHSHDPMDPVYERVLLERYYGPEALRARIDGDPDYTSRPHWLKMGDEIGKVTGATHINGLPDCRASYLAYMREAAGGDPAYFGIRDFDALVYRHGREPNMNRYERRIYYHNRRFIWWFTAAFYRRHTEAARTYLPNLLTRCNYTPGGPTFAGDMDKSNWLILPRLNASTAHSAEDWLSSGDSYTSQAGVQTEAYYAALVAAGARPNGQPMDFIMVGRNGELDRKMALLVGGGIEKINVYSWGPQYALGYTDSFSNVPRVYAGLNRGARALGPAEDYILDGTPAPARTAILYNRTNEIWHGDDYGVAADRIYTYLALRHAQVPADLVLEEDLTAEGLAPYRVLYLSGLNIQRARVPALRQWVADGGLLIAAAGGCLRDEYDDPIPEMAALLGATQRHAAVSRGRWMTWYIKDHEPVDTLTLQATDRTPAAEFGVIGLKTVLTPRDDAQTLGVYPDGGIGALQRVEGQGRVLTLGFMPGLSYAQNAPRDARGKPTTYSPLRRAVIAQPALHQLGEQAVTYSEALTDVKLFTHPDALAVILVDFTYTAGTPATLTVRTDRKIQSVTGSIGGHYAFRQEGDRVIIDCPTPEALDILVLK